MSKKNKVYSNMTPKPVETKSNIVNQVSINTVDVNNISDDIVDEPNVTETDEIEIPVENENSTIDHENFLESAAEAPDLKNIVTDTETVTEFISNEEDDEVISSDNTDNVGDIEKTTTDDLEYDDDDTELFTVFILSNGYSGKASKVMDMLKKKCLDFTVDKNGNIVAMKTPSYIEALTYKKILLAKGFRAVIAS